MKTKLLTGLSVFLISGATYAACPNNLSDEKMADCLSIERAGGNYQEEMKKAGAAEMVSPITGTDVREVKPAAGGATGADTATQGKTK